MRTYKQTHPWLSFELDLAQFDPLLWVLLGEIKSKSEHIAGVPLKATTAQKMLRLYLAKGAAATTAIEGNTLTEEQVLRRLEGKLQLPPSQAYLGVEVDNVIAACNGLAARLDLGLPLGALSAAEIIRYNGEILKGLRLSEGVISGQIRTHGVGVARYLGAPHEDCAYLLDSLCHWLESPEFVKGVNLPPMIKGFLKAVLAHLYIAWIHPFGDGNGRTARLVELRILLEAGIPQPAAHLLSNHFNQTRGHYYQELENSSVSGGQVVPFIRYAAQGFLDGLAEQLRYVRSQQWEMTWIEFVDERLKTNGGNITLLRRQRFMRALSALEEPVDVAKMTSISVEVARDYAGRTAKTVARDLKALIELKLVAKEGGKIRALKENILAFLPVRAGHFKTSAKA